MLKNKLGIENAVELAREEERISKTKAKEMFESDFFKHHKSGQTATLLAIHRYLLEDVYEFAGEIRDVNISKGSFRFAAAMYLKEALAVVEKMPQSSYEKIIEKYVEMNIIHPFAEGNGRSMRIWLDHMLREELKMAVDWSKVSKEDYLLAMERSPVKDIEIKELLRKALTEDIHNREIYLKGLDNSYFYEGLNYYKAEEL